MERLQIVKTRQHVGAAVRNIGTEGRQIRTHVAHQIDFETEKLAVRRECHFRGRDIVAALCVAEEMIGAVRDPLHTLLQLTRGESGERIFAIRE